MTTTKYHGLGRGLETLLQTRPNDARPLPNVPMGFQKLPIFNLQSGQYQPRKHFDENALRTLADSIRSQGLVQPIIVQKLDDKMFEIVAGERRWRAAQLAGLAEVPVVVRDDIEPQQAMAVALIENIQREDLNVMEEAEGFKRLHEEFAMTHEQIAAVVGRSRAAITNSLRLLELDEKVQDLVRQDRLKMGHARALLSLDEEAQQVFAERAVGRNMSVRQVERAVQQALADNSTQSVEHSTTAVAIDATHMQQLRNSIIKTLHSEVKINTHANGSGYVQIPFRSVAELQSLADAWTQALIDRNNEQG